MCLDRLTAPLLALVSHVSQFTSHLHFCNVYDCIISNMLSFDMMICTNDVLFAVPHIPTVQQPIEEFVEYVVLKVFSITEREPFGHGTPTAFQCPHSYYQVSGLLGILGVIRCFALSSLQFFYSKLCMAICHCVALRPGNDKQLENLYSSTRKS